VNLNKRYNVTMEGDFPQHLVRAVQSLAHEIQIEVEREGERDGKNINQDARQGSYYRPPHLTSTEKKP
jgi:hypothetical protein